jgi:hypothetical protein
LVFADFSTQGFPNGAITMDANRKIQQILDLDINKSRIDRIEAVYRRKDLNHLERRQQQRAISNAMISVALLYGKKRFSRGAIIFTLNDRNLKWTPYAKFSDVLRGLRVVCLSGPPDARVLTAYWHEHTKQKVRK